MNHHQVLILSTNNTTNNNNHLFVTQGLQFSLEGGKKQQQQKNILVAHNHTQREHNSCPVTLSLVSSRNTENID
jgi:hypothetical protein